VADIYEAIIVVFVVGQVRIELAVAVSRENWGFGNKPVINPNILGGLDSDAIPIRRKYILTDYIANNDVILLPNEKANPNKF
jgi:hypothetical protein